ncbi:uncharacterized protein STEHIDRAFT_155643 [Stereum hirsutum FP-91666 SS1]|uniref:uncharacterized protein n=1 Tax=Stereum hirsutum (strain FP-91666) TaxID=721885 RepID=UPI000440E277|nr:uncharacterized protein STEHIDRAFT_155643 [Stereum hirsutum FP-91666 SS1]EIM88289.1 hypothetical protein STEHIDRAFT_155643 [Stereum hirsutum FP-91666 SS1]
MHAKTTTRWSSVRLYSTGDPDRPGRTSAERSGLYPVQKKQEAQKADQCAYVKHEKPQITFAPFEEFYPHTGTNGRLRRLAPHPPPAPDPAPAHEVSTASSSSSAHPLRSASMSSDDDSRHGTSRTTTTTTESSVYSSSTTSGSSCTTPDLCSWAETPPIPPISSPSIFCPCPPERSYGRVPDSEVESVTAHCSPCQPGPTTLTFVQECISAGDAARVVKATKTLAPPSESLADLNYARQLRTRFFAHGVKMGVRMTQDKLDAIARGDLSGQLVHPVFVHIAHLIGSIFYHGAEHGASNRAREERDLRMVFHEISKEDALPRFAFVQVKSLLAYYHLFKKDIPNAWERMQEASEFVRRHDMHIAIHEHGAGSVPKGDGPLTAADAADEEATALVQMLYRDKCSGMMISVPLMPPQHLDDEFRNWTSASLAQETDNLMITRTICVSLLFESRAFLQQWGTQQSLTPEKQRPLPPILYENCSHLIHRIQAQLAQVYRSLQPNIASSPLPMDRLSTLTRKGLCIICWTALINMYSFLGHGMGHEESRRRLVKAATEVVRVSDPLAEAEYNFLDAIIFMCWNIVRDVLLTEYSLRTFAGTERSIQVPLEAVDLPPLLDSLQRYAQKLASTTPGVPSVD